VELMARSTALLFDADKNSSRGSFGFFFFFFLEKEYLDLVRWESSGLKFSISRCHRI
jgi:hypothetical protein